MKAGVIVKAGLKMLPKGAWNLLDCFEEILAVREFGGSLLKDCRLLNVSLSGLGYKQRICRVMEAFVASNVDLVVTIGGDGLASYAASALIMNQEQCPKMLGIPAGTANIGPIVTSSFTDGFGSMELVELDAIEVADGEDIVGYAFNDLIIGDSFLGTDASGNVRNYSASVLALEDRLETCVPSPDILESDFRISLNDEVLPFRQWNSVKQICASTLQNEELSGRAVFGGLINSVGMEHGAAIAMMDRIAVDSNPENWNYKGLVATYHLCFQEGDTVRLSGLSEKGQLIIDGNPFVRRHDAVRIRCRKAAIRAWERKNAKG